MKKTVIIFVIAGIVLLSVFLWLKNSSIAENMQEILMLSGIIIVVGFALFIGISRMKSVIRKEPAEDELSKRLLVKASSLSFYISIYFWLFLMYMSDKVILENHTLIGVGILGMSLLFFLSWLGLKIFGLKYV